MIILFKRDFDTILTLIDLNINNHKLVLIESYCPLPKENKI